MGGKNSGRTPDLTPKVQAAIVKAIAQGNPGKIAAKAAGVSERAFFYWLAWGRKKKDPIYIAFLAAVEKAEGISAKSSVAVVKKAANGVKATITKVIKFPDGTEKTETTTKKEYHWQAAAWLLERTNPEEFALKYKRELESLVESALDKAIKNGQLKLNVNDNEKTKTESEAKEKGSLPDTPDPSTI
jgi:hypothetical protein